METKAPGRAVAHLANSIRVSKARDEAVAEEG
jgi:hypothetical protein